MYIQAVPSMIIHCNHSCSITYEHPLSAVGCLDHRYRYTINHRYTIKYTIQHTIKYTIQYTIKYNYHYMYHYECIDITIRFTIKCTNNSNIPLDIDTPLITIIIQQSSVKRIILIKHTIKYTFI